MARLYQAFTSSSKIRLWYEPLERQKEKSLTLNSKTLELVMILTEKLVV